MLIDGCGEPHKSGFGSPKADTSDIFTKISDTVSDQDVDNDSRINLDSFYTAIILLNLNVAKEGAQIYNHCQLTKHKHGMDTKDFIHQLYEKFETNGMDLIHYQKILNLVQQVITQFSMANIVGHMRLVLLRHRKIAEETEGKTTEFDGGDEAVTMSEIAEEIRYQMKLAREYVVEGPEVNEYSKDYDTFQNALKLFDDAGIPNGGVQFGIFLNTCGASAFTYNLYTRFFPQHATLETVKIHGMKHNMEEYVRLHVCHTGDIINKKPFNGPLDLKEIFETADDITDPKYKGNISTDAYISSNKLSDNSGYLQLQLVLNHKIVACGGSDFYESKGNENIQTRFNSDVLIHSGKRINGLRLEGVEYVVVKNLEVYDLYDSSVIGKETCGAYDDFCALCGTAGGHFPQTRPMQVGGNVNAAQDVVFKDLYFHNIASETGVAFDIYSPACDLKIHLIIMIVQTKHRKYIVSIHLMYASVSYDGSTTQSNMTDLYGDKCDDLSSDLKFQEVVVNEEDSSPKKMATSPATQDDSTTRTKQAKS